jgi:Dyp-type peroxidase family
MAKKASAVGLDLSKPVDHRSADVAPFLAELQGNILKGHGRDRVRLVFLRFRKDAASVAAAKRWIAGFAGSRVTSATRQFAEIDDFRRLHVPAGLFANFLLSRTGYAALNVAPPQNAPFLAGMKGRNLADPEVATWDEGYRDEVHAAVLLAEDDVSELESAFRGVVAETRGFADVVAGESGNVLRNEDCAAIEHFGYVDGRSQPLLVLEDVQAEGKPTSFDASAPAGLVLVADPNGVPGVSFGSYLVFRKLEQNVRGFKAAEQSLADALGLVGDDRERAGASAVGRFEDGTPIVLQPNDGLRDPVPNDFGFDSDAAGLKCPLQAHIRKMNPRGGTISLGATPEQERGHRIARRGITYGERCTHPREGLSAADLPERDVGLLFMCFQADVGNQFEFMQARWANASGFPSAGTGVDPVIGQGDASVHSWPAVWGMPQTRKFAFEGFVTMKGGEYFFAPSMSFLRNLSAAPDAGAGGQALNVVVRRGSEAAERVYASTPSYGEKPVEGDALAPGLSPSPAQDLVFHGGRTLARMSYANIYVGGQTAWKGSDAANIDAALAKAMTDVQLNNVLRQYFPGKSVESQFRGATKLTGPAPKKVTRGDLERMLFALRKNGTLGGPQLDSTVFNFLLPRGTVLTTGLAPSSASTKADAPAKPRPRRKGAEDGVGHAAQEASSLNGLGGYHGSTTVDGQRLYFSVSVFSEGNNGIVAFGTPWKNVVATLYHELCEARTDPDVEEGNRKHDGGLFGWVSAFGEEIGDHPIAEASSLSLVFKEVQLADGGVVPIQLMYSNAVDGPEGPIALPH